VYQQTDIALLHEVDEVHQLSGEATCHILHREYEGFGKKEFERLSRISASHIYNLRHRVSYQRMGKIFTKTKPRVVNIGKREKPDPQGKPGFLRVDTVHQGDKNKQKGVYFINVIDEVTQWEFVFCVKTISERYLKGVLQALYKLCPYKVVNFHSDNGSEYINKTVAQILNRLYIKQTKSRPRKSNDNALVESKNSSIIRKHFGYFHIPATEHNAHVLSSFCINYLNPYLNYHRPCGFATTVVDKKGKEKKKYDKYMTPYERFKCLKDAEQYLRPGISFKELDQIAYVMSDTEFARLMNGKKVMAFKNLKLKKNENS
jgi:transposase InsO family protein